MDGLAQIIIKHSADGQERQDELRHLGLIKQHCLIHPALRFSSDGALLSVLASEEQDSPRSTSIPVC